MTYNPGQQPGWPTSPPPVEPPRKRRRWPWWVGGGVVALIVVAAIAGGGNSGGNTPTAGTTTSPVTAPLTPGDPGSPAGQIAATSAAPAQDTIVYTITGGHAQDITYIAPNLQESQITDRTVLPWSKTFTAPAGSSGLGMSLDAQNAGGGTIGCSISVNGRVVVSNSSSGQYALVMCTDTGSN